MPTHPGTRPHVMTRGLTLLFAVAGGAAVGNLYWAQPLLGLIAGDLDASPATAGWLVTATQLGYAAGILLIVPLGDRLDRRRLIPRMLVLAAAALACCAVAPSIGTLLAAMVLLGATTVSGQLLTPLAGDLADDDERGRVVGVVVSGILIGILASRTVSGLVAGVAGWRALYAAAAVVAVLFAVVLHRAIPAAPVKTTLSYPRLIASVAGVVRDHQVVRWTLALGATGFATFTMFWTALTLLLSAPPFGYPVEVVGLIGLAGLAGAIAAQRAGRLHDRGLSLPATGVSWAVTLLVLVAAIFSGRSIVLILVLVVVLDISLQAANILNQLRILAVSHEARSRLNTAYVTGNFLGGAVGSGLTSVLWAAGGWTAVMIAGSALGVLALSLWAALTVLTARTRSSSG